MSNESQEFKLLITGDAASAVEAFQKTAAESQKLNEEMGVVNVSAEDATKAMEDAGAGAEKSGQKIEAAGNKAAGFWEKHRKFRAILGELNRISPGLGEAMELLSTSFLEAGEGAEAGATGVAAFNTALEEVIITLGPLVIAMLGIEVAMQAWDRYKEKAKEAAEETEAATKRIDDAVHQAVKAVHELDEAMHPKKHNLAEQDEDDAKQQQQNLENTYNRQKELNRANQQRETDGAGSASEKEQIQKRYALLDAQLEDWRNKQKAAIEQAEIGTMNLQLAQLKDAQDKLIQQSAADYRKGEASGDMKDYNATAAKLQKNADEAKAIREKLDELTPQQAADASNAAYESETNRQVFGVNGQRYTAPQGGGNAPAPNTGLDDAANKFTTGQGIADLASRGGKISDEQQQFLVVLEQSITGQKLTFGQAVALIEAQAKNTDFAATLIGNAQNRIEVVSQKLAALERQMNQHSFNNH